VRRSLAAAAVAAAAVLAAGLTIVLSSGDGDGERSAGQVANLWIDGDGGSCARRDSPGAYRDAEACESLAAAYGTAASGDEVRVRSGAYGPQEIVGDNARLTRAVTVRPAEGEKVTFASLTTGGDHLTIRDIALPIGSTHRRGWFNTGSDVVLQNVDISGPEASASITGGARVTYRDSDFGTPGNTIDRECGTGNGEPFEVSEADDVLVENVDFHPFIAGTGAVCGTDRVMHLETVRIGDDVHDMTISRTRFLRGDGSGTARIFATGAGGRDATGLTIVNTWIGRADGERGGAGNGVVLAGGTASCEGFVIAYSYWEGGMNDAQCPTKPAYYGNLGAIPDYLGCPGSRAGANLWVWTTAKTGCGTDRWLVDASPDPLLAYRHEADGYHLTPKSPAIDAADAAETCQELTGGVDIDGEPRDGRCDAGPDEFVP
jgi:hypothetical protein